MRLDGWRYSSSYLCSLPLPRHADQLLLLFLFNLQSSKYVILKNFPFTTLFALALQPQITVEDLANKIPYHLHSLALISSLQDITMKTLSDHTDDCFRRMLRMEDKTGQVSQAFQNFPSWAQHESLQDIMEQDGGFTQDTRLNRVTWTEARSDQEQVDRGEIKGDGEKLERLSSPSHAITQNVIL